MNEDVKNFYDGKKMNDINKSTMPEWLDIVSNLNFTDIYNTSGDIHNNVNNLLSNIYEKKKDKAVKRSKMVKDCNLSLTGF